MSAHSESDATDLVALGKYERIVGVEFWDDKPIVEYLDTSVGDIAQALERVLSGRRIEILDESWDRRYYLVFAQRDTHAGTYYRYDTHERNLLKIADLRPQLTEASLAAMQPYAFETRDGVRVPAYLTLPPRSTASDGPHPVVVLPHGGWRTRDIWKFDATVQFFASLGYAVLQVNYRGSGGYGEEWFGKGPFRGWQRVVRDLEDGVASLIERGIANPGRLCIVGFEYGGYAALLSIAEYPTRYRCGVGVGAETDPLKYLKDARGVRTKRFLKSLVGWDLGKGIPRRRAEDIRAPVLLVHAELDPEVDLEQSEMMEKALRRAGKPVKLVEFEDIGLFHRRERDSIDLLRRLGEFLDEHLAAPREARSSQSGKGRAEASP